MAHPLIIAHRGGEFWKGENFSYITDSIRDGADIIELDIRVKNGTYIVQHMPWEKVQGTLEEALRRVEKAKLYLDIKTKIDINEFIAYVRSLCSNDIIIGTYDLEMLRGIRDKSVIRNCHCVLPWTAIKRGRQAQAGWVNVICHMTTKRLAKKIQDSGFKFVPSGNQIFKRNEIFGNQIKYSTWGAWAIASYRVKRMKQLLQTQDPEQSI